MKQSKINLDTIDSLNNFYILFEEYALLLEKNHEALEILLKYKNKTQYDDEKQKLQWEVEAFLFSFIKDKVFSFCASNGEEVGEVNQYPQLDKIQSDAFGFIEHRANLSTSPLLKARYNHLLWKGVIKKNKKFATSAAENYIEAINLCYQQLNEDENNYSFLIGKLFERLTGIVNEVNICIEDVKNLVIMLLYTPSNLSFYTKHSIVNDMLGHPKIFKAVDFKNVLQLFESEIKHTNRRPDDFMLVHQHLPTAIKVAQKQKVDVKRWYNEIGYAYLRMAAEETLEERNWLKLDNYRAAIDAFRQSGNAAKKEEAEQLYFQLKPKIKLDEHRVDFDEATVEKLKGLNEELKEQALQLLKNPPEYIYSIIAKGNFFPKYEHVLEGLKNKGEDHFLKFVTTIEFDNNKNITKKLSENTEKEEILALYGTRMTGTLLPFFHYLIIFGIKSGHLTYKNLLTFFIQHSWIGKSFIKTDLSGNPETINLVKQITPSIVEFFGQVLAWGESNYYQPNFILCIDSLTLKIEGIFRNFSERLNISTSKGKKKGMQEALTHDIINNEIIKKYFDESDRLLFDYVYSNEGGLNLRNNIAHCFYSENEYHPDKMLLLLAVLFRLGKYNITAKPNNNTV